MTDLSLHDDRRAWFFQFVRQERARQDEKWGEQNHANGYFLGILTEEVGEVAEAIIALPVGEASPAQLRQELIQVAAVAVSWYETVQRRQGQSLTQSRALAAVDHDVAWSLLGRDAGGFLAILTKALGEVATAMIEHHFGNSTEQQMLDRLLHLAAVAGRWHIAVFQKGGREW